MRILTIAAALVALAPLAVPAQAQPRHEGWRHGHHDRDCRTVWRHGHRERRCHR